MKQRTFIQLASLIVALGAVLFGGGQVAKQLMPRADSNTQIDESHALVYRVVDGDTFELINGQKVRFIGINTPEAVDPRKPVEYYGKEASAYTKELLENRYVTMTRDVTNLDKYGRLLRYVYLGDGTFVNEKLVREGYAQVYTFPPNVKFQSLFQDAQQDAREHNRGMWK